MITDKEEAAITAELQQAVDVLKAYAGSDASNAAIALLDVLAASYVPGLMHCTAAELPKAQASINQVLALRRVFAGDEFAHPRI